MKAIYPTASAQGRDLLHTADHELAARLAFGAGQRLLRLRASGDDPQALRAAGDRLSHEFLTGELAQERPRDAVLSEEGKDSPERLGVPRVWIIDPLDGTREFGEPGRTDWAVHVALWEDGALVAGAVALPAQDQLLSTAAPPEPPSSRTGVPQIAVSRTRAPAFVGPLAAELGARLVPLGSAGAKVAAVICGNVDIYVHDGGQYEWDSAAPVAVALAAGLHASRIDGSRLEYNKENPWLPDILVCRTEEAGMVLRAVETARG